ncbi:hypothetical protein L209DRAFT_759560 [Thermothelomyces heterothallicus CBS 203.75]
MLGARRATTVVKPAGPIGTVRGTACTDSGTCNSLEDVSVFNGGPYSVLVPERQASGRPHALPRQLPRAPL